MTYRASGQPGTCPDIGQPNAKVNSHAYRINNPVI